MLKLAIHGRGQWGARLADSVKDSERVRFVKVITRKDDYARELADPAIDGVVLATPHSQHAEQIISAAKAGKHVFVEKPFALTRASAQSAVDACRAAGVTLGVGFNRRYAPAFIEMQRRIRGGAIGELQHVEGQFSGSGGYRLKPDSWRALRSESPGGAMTARGVHVLDAMIAIAGPLKSVVAFSERRKLALDVDDVTVALMRFGSGLTGYLASLYASGDLWRLQVYGAKGWLEMRGETELAARELDGPIQVVSFTAVNKERAELEDFAAAVAARKPCVVPAEEIVNGVAVLEALTASAGKSVEL